MQRGTPGGVPAGDAAAPFARLASFPMLSAALLLLGPGFVLAGDFGTALDSVQAADIRGHLDVLCQDRLEGREAGTRENAWAEDYIADAFRRLGLRPIGGGYHEVVRKPGSEALYDGPRSRFEVTDGTGDSSYKVWLDPGADLTAVRGSPIREVTGPVAFAGYGIETPEYSDYEDLAAAGKVVVVLRGAPRQDREGTPFEGRRKRDLRSDSRKVETAAKKGAVAVVLVNPPRRDGPDHPLNRLRITAGGDQEAPIPVYHARRLAIDRILLRAGLTVADVFRQIESDFKPCSADLPGITILLRNDIRARPFANVIGMLEGTDRRGEVVVVGAHLDHIGLGGFASPDPEARGLTHPGADDNASGIAALLEIAEVFYLAPERPRRSIVFVAFNGEEKGLLGSSHYVADPPVPLGRTVFMMNLDMVGRSRNALTVFGAATGSGLQEIFEGANRGIGLDLRFESGIPSNSDHWSFLIAGVPVAMLFTGMHADYHRPSDRPEAIDVDSMVRIARLAASVVRDVADLAEGPEFRLPAGLGLLGIQAAPDPRGVLVRSVVDSRVFPAKRAGLEPGDVVVAVDGKAVKGFRDIRNILRKKTMTERITIRFIRGDETLERTVSVGPPRRRRL